MIYRVSARFLSAKAREFHRLLIDGTISSMQPDGPEMVASMKRARVVEDGVVRWYERCYCPTPLRHERATVYDRFFSDFRTESVEDYGRVEGASFWGVFEQGKGE